MKRHKLDKGRTAKRNVDRSPWERDTDVMLDAVASVGMKDSGLAALSRITKKVGSKANFDAFRKSIGKIRNVEARKAVLVVVKGIITGKYKPEFRLTYGGRPGDVTKVSQVSTMFDVFNQAVHYDEPMQNRNLKPKVQKIVRTVQWSEASVDMDYDKFAKLDSAETYFQEKPLSAKKAIRIAHEMGVEIPSSVRSVETLDTWLRELLYGEEGRGFIIEGDNTHSWSYFGPSIDFIMLQEGNEIDHDSPMLVIAAMHLGGDVRGNYGSPAAFYFEVPSEQAPFFNWEMVVELVTDQGSALFGSDDIEGYHLRSLLDHTGTVEENLSFSPDELEKHFDFSGVEDK